MSYDYDNYCGWFEEKVTRNNLKNNKMEDIESLDYKKQVIGLTKENCLLKEELNRYRNQLERVNSDNANQIKKIQILEGGIHKKVNVASRLLIQRDRYKFNLDRMLLVLKEIYNKSGFTYNPDVKMEDFLVKSLELIGKSTEMVEKARNAEGATINVKFENNQLLEKINILTSRVKQLEEELKRVASSKDKTGIKQNYYCDYSEIREKSIKDNSNSPDYGMYYDTIPGTNDTRFKYHDYQAVEEIVKKTKFNDL